MKRVLTLVLALTITSLMLPNLSFSQAQKRVLIEDFTSSTCPPCASLNPSFHAWIEAHRSTISIVSFHMNWPSPGNDPMFMVNQTENTARRNYYGVNSIPEIIMEGTKTFIGTISGMDTWYGVYLAQSTPVGIGITDTRFATDSIRTNVRVNNFTNLPTGVYTLKVFVLEHALYYPPGSSGCTNGETDFPDVFRKALTNISGNLVSTNAGIQDFEFRFKRDPSWTDANVFTIAFVQNEGDKTSMNTVSSNFPTPVGIEPPYSNQVPSDYALNQNYPNPFNPTTNIKFNLPKSGEVTLKIYDILGNEVKTIVEGVQPAGVYNMTVDGTNLASGIYFYTLKAGNFVETKKMSLIK